MGLLLVLVGFFLLFSKAWGGVIPIVVGVFLIFLRFGEKRTLTICFGHFCIFLGCFLITWGIYLLPYSKPTVIDIFSKPLFWGLFSIGGGICANYHGFCKCVRKK